MLPSKILVTGGTGLLGSELKKHLKADFVGSKDMDITKLLSVVRMGAYDLIIHAAAYTDVLKAEREFSKCFKVNYLGTKNLVYAFHDTPFVYISTEYAKDPLGVYAASKYLAEKIVESHPQHLIIRTLFKPNPWPFDKAFIDQYTQGDYVDVIAPLIVEEVKEWYLNKDSDSIYLGTGRKTMYELAMKTKPDVSPNSVDDYNEKIGRNLIPKDYL